MKQKIKMKMPNPPDGFEYTGDYRRPGDGEYYLGLDGEPVLATHNHSISPLPILRKAKKPRCKPAIELMDKHAYLREDGSISFVFKTPKGFFGYFTSVGTFCPPMKESSIINDSYPIVECIGRIGVVKEGSCLNAGSNPKGSFSCRFVYNPDNLTGKRI